MTVVFIERHIVSKTCINGRQHTKKGEIQVKYSESSWPESKPMLTITHPISSHCLIAWLNQPIIMIAS